MSTPALFKWRHFLRLCRKNGFGAIESAKRFCQAFDEVKQFLRPRARMTELVSLSKQREQFAERVDELQKLFQAI